MPRSTRTEPPAVTVTAPEPPAAPMVWLVGAIENVQGGASCVAVNVCPAIVSVPTRCGPVLAATANDTLPLPLPAAAPVIVSQSMLFDAAVHPQFAAAVIATAPPPPDAASVWAPGEIENVHGTGCWVTVSV